MTVEITRKQSSKRRLPSKHLSIYITCVRERVKLCLAETCERRQKKRHYHLSALEDGRRVVSETYLFGGSLSSDVFVVSSRLRVDNGLLPGGLPGESGYLGWEILFALRV